MELIFTEEDISDKNIPEEIPVQRKDIGCYQIISQVLIRKKDSLVEININLFFSFM